MATWAWIILVIGIIVVFGITSIVVCLRRKSNCRYCEYWVKHWWGVKPCWNDGWILDILRVVFWYLSKLSISRAIVFCKEKKYWHGHKNYQCVDWYVFSWVLVIIVFSVLVTMLNISSPFTCIIIGFVSYRLFDIFQSWVSQYVIGGVPRQWEPRNIYRSLVLVFVGYLEITFSFVLLAFMLQDNFLGINCWQQSFRYSIGNAVTVGSVIIPTTGIGYALFATQLMFTLLFLVAAVNRIIAAIK